MKIVSITRAVPEDDRPEWDVAVSDPDDADFYVEGCRWSDHGEAVAEAEWLAFAYDAVVRDETATAGR